MDNSQNKRRRSRHSRVLRIRKKLQGTALKPRLSVSKTNSHIYAQLIDDEAGVSLGGIGTLSKANQGTPHGRRSKESARHIGTQLAELAKKLNLVTVVFDRGRNKYHGIVAELANAARDSGLQF